jgi:MFS family permease
LFVVLGASMCGDQIAAVALLFRLVDDHRPGVAVAILFGALVVPRAVVGPFAGALVDRHDTRRIVAVAVAGQAFIAVGLAVTTDVVVSIAGAYALGVLGTVVNAAVFAMLPTIFGSDRVMAANSYYELAMSFSASAGPILGGVLVVWWGGSSALLVDAATFAMVVPVVIVAPFERPSAVEAHQRRWFDDARLGMRMLMADRVIRRTMAAVVTGVVATSAVDVALVYLVGRYLHAGGIAYGIMLGLWGVGMMIGSVFASRSTRPGREHAWLVGGIAVIGLAIFAAGVAPSAIVLAVTSFVGGVANALFNIAGRSLVHRRIDARYHGRVGAARLAIISVAVAIGFVVGGIFGPSASRTVYIVAGLVTMAATAVGRGVRFDATPDGDSSVVAQPAL